MAPMPSYQWKGTKGSAATQIPGDTTRRHYSLQIIKPPACGESAAPTLEPSRPDATFGETRPAKRR